MLWPDMEDSAEPFKYSSMFSQDCSSNNDVQTTLFMSWMKIYSSMFLVSVSKHRVQDNGAIRWITIGRFFAIARLRRAQLRLKHGTILLSRLLPPASRLCTPVLILVLKMYGLLNLECMVYWTLSKILKLHVLQCLNSVSPTCSEWLACPMVWFGVLKRKNLKLSYLKVLKP